METISSQPQINEEWQNWEKRSRRGKILGGILLVIIGGLLLAREFGADLPWWLFSWKMLLIGIGVVSGLKNGFTRTFWMVPLGVGSAFLLNDFYPGLVNTHMLWPVVLILLGLAFIFKPRRRWGPGGADRCKKKWQGKWDGQPIEPNSMNTTGESELDINAFMSGVEKVLISKNFRKGEINAVMGGAQVDMSQSDISGSATLEINAVLGGIKLIVPAHWEVRSELNCLMGGVEDKRRLIPPQDGADRKVLILEGNAFMGGIEIRNY